MSQSLLHSRASQVFLSNRKKYVSLLIMHYITEPLAPFLFQTIITACDEDLFIEILFYALMVLKDQNLPEVLFLYS